MVLARHLLAVGYRITTYSVLKCPEGLLLGHQTVKSSARPFSTPIFSSRATRCRQRWATFPIAASTPGTRVQCVPWAPRKVLSKLLLAQPHSTVVASVQSSSEDVVEDAIKDHSSRNKSVGRFSDPQNYRGKNSESPSSGSTKSPVGFVPFCKSMQMTCWILYKQSSTATVLHQWLWPATLLKSLMLSAPAVCQSITEKIAFSRTKSGSLFLMVATAARAFRSFLRLDSRAPNGPYSQFREPLSKPLSPRSLQTMCTSSWAAPQICP